MAKALRLTSKQVGLKYGFRSGLEEKIAEQLKQEGVSYQYEGRTIRYEKPAKTARYTCDFIIERDGKPDLYLETKGRFLTADRQKHLLIKAQYPELDIRFVFSNSKQRISKTSQTRYCDWCDKHGFAYADGEIPKSWLKEKAK